MPRRRVSTSQRLGVLETTRQVSHRKPPEASTASSPTQAGCLTEWVGGTSPLHPPRLSAVLSRSGAVPVVAAAGSLWQAQRLLPVGARCEHSSLHSCTLRQARAARGWHPALAP